MIDKKGLQKALASKKVSKKFREIRVLCGPMRFRIVITLYNAGKEGMSVNDLARVFGASPSRISHQLSILKRHGFVRSKKKGSEHIYRFGNHGLPRVLGLE